VLGRHLSVYNITKVDDDLEKSEQNYLLGDFLCGGDMAMFWIVAFVHRIRNDFQLEELPHLNSWYDRICTNDAIKAVWPAHWDKDNMHAKSDPKWIEELEKVR